MVLTRKVVNDNMFDKESCQRKGASECATKELFKRLQSKAGSKPAGDGKAGRSVPADHQPD